MWIDEGFSIYHARHSLATLWGSGWELESSPPLYYSALWGWTRLFGDSEPVARALSLLFTALAALCLYGAATALCNRLAGAVAAILFLCQPLVFEYSLEVRPYALQVLLICAALAASARAMVNPEQDRLATVGGTARRMAPIVATCALATYTHSTTPVFLGALFGAAAVYGVTQRGSRTFWVAWFLTGCAVLVAIVPQLLVMHQVLATNQRGISWIPVPDSRYVSDVLRSLAIGDNSRGLLETALVGGGFSCAIIWCAWRLRDRPLPIAVGLVLPALGFAGLWGVSWLQPVLLPRTSLWVVAPLCMLIGCAVTTIKRRAFRLWMPLVVLVPALALVSVHNMNNRTAARPWPPLFSQSGDYFGPNDEAVAVDPEIHCVFDYYRHRQAQRTVKQWRLERGPEQVYRSRQRIPLGCNEAEPLTIEALSSRLVHGKGVWLLAGDDLQRRDMDAALQALGPAVRITHRYESQGKIYAWRLVDG